MRDKRGDAGCGCRVPTDWFKHNACGFYSDLVNLIRDNEAMLPITEDRYLFEKIAAEPPAGLLEQRLRSSQSMELLRIGLPR